MKKQYSKEECEILAKIQLVKHELLKKNLKMTGYNKFQNYYYFEHKDIVYPITELLLKNGLASKFDFNKRKGRLRIVDTKTGAYMEWTTDLTENTIETKKGLKPGGMKGKQALQTYGRRTLWLQALEIAEVNIIELSDEETEEKPRKSQKNKNETEVENCEAYIKRFKEYKDPDESPEEYLQVVKSELYNAGYDLTKDNIVKSLNSKQVRGLIHQPYKEKCLKVLEEQYEDN